VSRPAMVGLNGDAGAGSQSSYHDFIFELVIDLNNFDVLLGMNYDAYLINHMKNWDEEEHPTYNVQKLCTARPYEIDTSIYDHIHIFDVHNACVTYLL
jgi:hypothetical protein